MSEKLTGAHLLEMRGVSHVFSNGTAALQNVDFHVNTGEFLAIAGAIGSGKTVLARHMNGLLTPTEGEVLLEGKPLAKNLVHARRTIGMVFQDSDSQIVGQTLAEDVAFGLENVGYFRSDAKAEAQKQLDNVGLGHLARSNPRVLSGGQKRKLALAGVIAMKPQVIVLDEPFCGLDYPSVTDLLKQLVALHSAGHAIVVVTHELEKVLAHADRLIVLEKGRIVLNGAPCDTVWRVEPYGVRCPLRKGEPLSRATWLTEEDA